MDWGKGRESENVVENGDGGGGGFGGGGGLRFGGFHIGLGGILVIVVVSLLLGKNPLEILSLLSGGDSASIVQEVPPGSQGTPSTESDEPHRFVRTILGSTEDVWTEYFQARNQRYARPTLKLFNGRVRTACGTASEAMGPFYCPGDQLVYLDLSFFHEMESRFHAAGDFARAYVIAHEVGHHVQNLLGIMRQVSAQQQRGVSMEGANGLSVRLSCRRTVLRESGQSLAGAAALDQSDRCQCRPERRISGGGRHAAETGARLRRARLIHPRLGGSASALVQHRLRVRRPQEL